VRAGVALEKGAALNISSSDVILLAHAAFGVLGCLTALWVFVETLNARPANAGRIQAAALLTALLMTAGWICGGYWYVHFYPRERALILGGPWPFAHNFFMETKEHLFFVVAILAFLLPITTRERLHSNSAARTLVLSVAGLIVVTGLSVEAAGAIIDHGVKIALLQDALKGTHSWIPQSLQSLRN
jgi:hypothetical protein